MIKQLNLRTMHQFFLSVSSFVLTFLLYSIKLNLKRENYSPYSFVPKIYTSSTTMKVHGSIILRTEPEWQRTTMRTRLSHRKGGGNSNKQETTEVKIVLCKLFNLSIVVCKLSSNVTHGQDD